MKSISRFSFSSILILTVLLAACEAEPVETTEAWAPGPGDAHAYVSTLGQDTVTVEVYSQTQNAIEGVLVERVPVTVVTSYSAELDPEGRIVALHGEQSSPEENPDGADRVAWNVQINDGKAVLERTEGDNPGTVEMDVSGFAIPTLGRRSSAMFVFEQVANHLTSSSDPSTIQLIGPTSNSPSTNNATVISADTIAMDFFGSPRTAWMDEDGQLLGASGAETTLKVETRRVAPFDPMALASKWAAMDARGEGIGAASIPGNVTATVDGANVEVVYSRPAMRGREIWGGLVRHGEVWRTGANAATNLAFNRDLVIEGTEVPAGTYTLWSIFTADDQTLIINSQTQQWGTQYDPAQDFARVPLVKSSLDEPVERFTISIDDTPSGGAIHLDWDRTRFSAEFTVQ